MATINAYERMAQNAANKAAANNSVMVGTSGYTAPTNALAQAVAKQAPPTQVSQPTQTSTATNNADAPSSIAQTISKATGEGAGNAISVSKIGDGTGVAKTPIKAVDNTDLINSQYDSFMSALKNQIQQNVNAKNSAITALPEKYQSDKNTSEVLKDQQVRTLNEMAANQGDRGGIGRQNTLNAMVGGENRLNTINMQQKAEEQGLRDDITNLTLQGDIQAAQMQAQKLKDLIANNTSVDNTNYQRQFDAEGRQISTDQFNKTFDQSNNQFNIGQSNWQNTFDYNKSNTQQARTDAQYAAQGLVYNPATGQYVKDAATLQNDVINKRNAENDKLAKTQIMAQLTGNIPAQALIEQMVPEQIKSYEALGNREGGFAGAMNSTQDPVQRAIIEAFRNRFLQSNPNNAYANTATAGVMVPTMQGQQVQSGLQTEAVQRAGMAIANKISQMNLDNLPEQAAAELKLAKLQAEKGNADLAYQLIINSNAPKKLKADLAATYEQIAASKANTSQGWAQLEIQKEKAATAGTKQTAAEVKADLNKSFGEDFQEISNMSVPDAKKTLETYSNQFIADYGIDGYKKLYNSALANAINMGQAQPMK